MAPGAVPGRLVPRDGGAAPEALDAGEVGAMNDELLSALQPPSQEGTSLLVALLPRLCEKLDAVAKQGDRLERVEDGQKSIADKIDKAAADHRELQAKYLEQSHRHELEIVKLTARLVNYEVTVEKVEKLDKNMAGIVLLAVVGGGVIGALFAGLPAWLERHQPQKDGGIMPPALARWRG